jgi:hypothetical protein
MRADDQNQLAESLQKGRLTAEQQQQLDAYLAVHPQERSAWDEELALNHLLDQMPDVSLSTNFTAQVLEMARRERVQREGIGARGWGERLLQRWMPKLATAALALCVGLFFYQQHRLTERKEMARQLSEVAKLATGTPLEVLENFEAIERLNHVPHDQDRELIAALQ